MRKAYKDIGAFLGLKNKANLPAFGGKSETRNPKRAGLLLLGGRGEESGGVC